MLWKKIINQNPHNVSIALKDIWSDARGNDGVTSVTISAPKLLTQVPKYGPRP